MIPKLLAERYEIQQQLGNQTGRRTFLALDRQTNSQVIIKVLLLGDDFEWQDLKLFEREAEILKTIDHPAIPRYLDYLELQEPNGFALIQTYIEARSLEAHLRSGRTFSETEVETLARSLLAILSYLHNHTSPIIHRDIKPSNILLSDDRTAHSPGTVYLVDFGSVQTIAAQTGGTITIVGTYGYMPPEQFGGRVSAASDLYSLGATLIYLLTGRHPVELPQENFQIQFRSLINIRPQFADWLEWMTEPALNRRFTSADEALNALDEPRPRTIAAPILRTQPAPTNRISTNASADTLNIQIRQENGEFLAQAVLTVTTLIVFWMTIGAFCGFGVSASIVQSMLLGIGAIASFILIPILKNQEFTLTPTKLYWKSVLFGLKWNRIKPLSISSIRHIILTYQQVSGVRQAIKLTIVSRNRQITIDDRQLTSAELVWISQQLSQWLRIPIAESGNTEQTF
ncbi:serine/threonine protein kinase [Leptolyngbya sp. AN03gr2]|uniref:serine/threonine protein kinase n=1 Tax=unclassified Leptolyngbya TaxID=2650499 RepID=UPI003D3119A8